MAQHSESDFLRVVPLILADNGGTCTTSEIISLIPNYVNLSAEDLEQGKRRGRSSDEPMYAQIVRNIVSHHRSNDESNGIVDLGGCILTRVPRLDDNGNVRVNVNGRVLVDVAYSLVDTDLLAIISSGAKKVGRKSRRRPCVNKHEYARRRAYNAHVGELGELFAYDFLRNHVAAELGADMADSVVHVGATYDGLGYDIVSVQSDGSLLYVEVKTTTAALASMPFYMSENERLFFEEHAEKDDAAIFRVFDFDTETKVGKVLFPIMASKLVNDYNFDPSSWKVSPKAGCTL